jgi:hypothetical protein
LDSGLTQSVTALHTLPSAHLVVGQLTLPPQSVSVSSPFLTPSPHFAAAHTCGDVAEHTPETQSKPTLQNFVSTQRFVQMLPPQSTSPSSPFFTLSSHLGGAQVLVPLVQTRSLQSALTPQTLLVGHLTHPLVVPPQSTSDSSWFLR